MDLLGLQSLLRGSRERLKVNSPFYKADTTARPELIGCLAGQVYGECLAETCCKREASKRQVARC